MGKMTFLYKKVTVEDLWRTDITWTKRGEDGGMEVQQEVEGVRAWGHAGPGNRAEAGLQQGLLGRRQAHARPQGTRAGQVDVAPGRQLLVSMLTGRRVGTRQSGQD